MTIRLELWRFLAESALDALTYLQLGPCSAPLKVWESISAEVFHFRKDSLQLLDALGQIIDRCGF